MGHHIDPQDRSMLVYSRDTYAPIAVAVRLMLDDITEGRFAPDLPRIDRIAQAVELAEHRDSGESSSSDDDSAADDEDRHPDIPQVPSTYLMAHKLSGVMHVSASELTFACGRKITSSFVGWSSNSFEMVDTDICAQCKAKAALHFGGNSSEQYEQSSEDLSD